MFRHYLKAVYTPLVEDTMLNIVTYIRTELSYEMVGRYFGDGMCSSSMIYDFLDEGYEVLEIAPECIS